MIAATVTVKTEICRFVFDAIGFSTWAIEEEARELVGDEPCSVSVVVIA